MCYPHSPLKGAPIGCCGTIVAHVQLLYRTRARGSGMRTRTIRTRTRTRTWYDWHGGAGEGTGEVTLVPRISTTDNPDSNLNISLRNIIIISRVW